MSVMKRFLLSITAFAVMCVLVVMPGSAAVPRTGYILNGGVTNRTYYTSAVGVEKYIYGGAVSVIVDDWNSAVQPTSVSSVNVLFTNATSAANATFLYSVQDRGDCGFSGRTYYYNSAGYSQVDSDGWPTANYDYTQMVLNTYELDKAAEIAKRNVASHEFGHAIGLAHDNNDALMCRNIIDTRSAVTPTEACVTTVRFIYR